MQIIDELVRGAAKFAEKSAISFHLTCRTAQFIESLGAALHACWYSPKNCQKLAIRTLSNCQLEVEWFLNLLEVKNVPILTNSLVIALTSVVKAIDFNVDHLEQVTPELRQLARPLLERLFAVLESFEHIKLDQNEQLSGAFETEFEFTTFRTRLTNQSGHLVKHLTKIIPDVMSEIFADLTASAIAASQFPTRIAISILTSSIPVLSEKTNLSIKFTNAFNQLLDFQPKGQTQLKVRSRSFVKLRHKASFQLKLELVRCHLEVLKLFETDLVKKTVDCLIQMCESIDGIDQQSSRLRRNSASGDLHILFNLNYFFSSCQHHKYRPINYAAFFRAYSQHCL